MGLQPELGLATRPSSPIWERMLYLLDSKTIPDNWHDVSIRFMDFVRDNPREQALRSDDEVHHPLLLEGQRDISHLSVWICGEDE